MLHREGVRVITCHVCHSPMHPATVTVCGVDGVSAYVCGSCGEAVVDEDEARRVETLLADR